VTAEGVWWNGRFFLPPPSPPKSTGCPAALPQRSRMTRDPYYQVVDAVKALTPAERISFLEATSALTRSADCDGVDGLLSLRAAYCHGTTALDRALALEWKRVFLSPRVKGRVERNWPERERIGDVLAQVS
jgi:hypothetical protein